MLPQPKKDEEKQTIGSKGYADDTAALTSTDKGMENMVEWVNEFCIMNRISMNERKTPYFGRDEKGHEAEKPMEASDKESTRVQWKRTQWCNGTKPHTPESKCRQFRQTVTRSSTSGYTRIWT